MSRAGPDPFLLVALTVCCAMAVLIGPRSLAVVGGTTLVLILPGFALGHLLVPRATSAQRAALSVGLSLAIAVLVGLGLAWADLLAIRPMASALCVVTAGLVLFLPDDEGPALERQESWRSAGAGACVLGAALVATMLAVNTARHHAAMVWRTTGPVVLDALRVGASRSDLRVDVLNLGPQPDRFAISIRLPGSEPWHWDAVDVGAGRIWTVTVRVPHDVAGRGTAELRSLSDPTLIRHVTTWIGPRSDDPWAWPAGVPHDRAPSPESLRSRIADVGPGGLVVATQGSTGETP